MSTLVSLPTAAPAPDYQSIDRPLNFSVAAASKVRELIQEEGNAELALRVYIQGGGCSGFQYGFELADQPAEDDLVVEAGGTRVFVDPVSLDLLAGSELEWNEALIGAHFVVRNPQAVSGCGCGVSFSIA
jgi:iron-sulfur cluster insertion protein